MRKPWLVSLAMLGCLLACGERSEGADAPAPKVTHARVVAVGDLHGDLDNALAVLRLAGVVDANGRWSGGNTILVQTGDTTDRGPDSKTVMDLLRRLSEEAPASGGKVVALLGNHEVMNLQGDLRYVHPGDTEAFGGAEARRAAFAKTGEYGAWLATLPAVAIEADTVFVHGGVAPAWAEKGLDSINEQVRMGLFDRSAAVLGPDGPLWYRGFVQDKEIDACPSLDRSLIALGADRMVVGHTTRRDGRIEVRCSGRLHVIDIGIASAYGGNLGAWEMIDADARAVYPSGLVDLEDPSP